MYDQKSKLMVDNSISRYSIGDRTKNLKYNKDGSLTIYIGNKKPISNSNNWLPAPKANFFLLMRLYGPNKSILEGKWIPPLVRKI